MEVALQDENEMVRQHVVRVVGERGFREAIPRLERMLAAEAEIVRANAARTIGDLGDASSIPALVRALDDPYFKVRSLASHSLGKIAAKDEQVLAALRARLAAEEHGMVKVDLAWNLALGGDRSRVAVVRSMLFEGDPEDVRAEAARALGEIGEDSDVALLQRALGDKKGLVRQEAFKSLEKLKKS
jgi:HEAT repeat protein